MLLIIALLSYLFGVTLSLWSPGSYHIWSMKWPAVHTDECFLRFLFHLRCEPRFLFPLALITSDRVFSFALSSIVFEFLLDKRILGFWIVRNFCFLAVFLHSLHFAASPCRLPSPRHANAKCCASFIHPQLWHLNVRPAAWSFSFFAAVRHSSHFGLRRSARQFLIYVFPKCRLSKYLQQFVHLIRFLHWGQKYCSVTCREGPSFPGCGRPQFGVSQIG